MLTQGTKSDWTEKLLHSFNPEAKDGAGPAAGLVLDGNRNLYGTTSEGGANSNCNYGCGTVFELTPSKDGGWTEKILHSFNGKDGDYPVAGLILDKSGNLYGTVTCNSLARRGIRLVGARSRRCGRFVWDHGRGEPQPHVVP
jgi:uncharacterized repeat protein (TIGR03803 family)